MSINKTPVTKAGIIFTSIIACLLVIWSVVDERVSPENVEMLTNQTNVLTTDAENAILCGIEGESVIDCVSPAGKTIKDGLNIKDTITNILNK